MFERDRLSRRGILKAGGIGGAALLATGVTGFSAAAASAPITVISSNSTLTNTLFNVVILQKYLDEFGVAMKPLHVADAATTTPALLGGQADMCLLSGIGLALATIAKGAAMKIVGSNCLLVTNAVYSAKHDVKSLKDLEGKVVGTGAIGALTYQLMVALMEKKDVDISKVTFRNVGSSTDIFRAVAAGTVDAGPSEIDVYAEQVKYGVHSLADGNFWTDLPEYTYQGAYASNQAIATKRDGLVRVLAAFAKMFQFIQTPESQDVFAKAREMAVGKNDLKEAMNSWNFFQKVKPYAPDLRLSEARIDYMQKLNQQFSMQKMITPYAQVTDMSLARDAVKLAGTGA